MSNYTPYYEGGWKNEDEMTTTPICAEALNHMEEGISAAYDIEPGETVPSSVRSAIYTLLSKAAYIETGLADEVAVVQAWASEVTGITISASAISISGASTSQLTAVTTPAGGAVTWASSNTDVATVSSTGLVTAVGNGTATITATSGTVSASCAVTVTGLATLTGIDATYTQSGTVYDTASLDDLKTDLVVTASYDDSSTATITDYVLNGTLAEGTSTITVSYGGFTDTFNVTVSEYVGNLLYKWDFTQSLTDSVQGLTATLGGSATQDTFGVHLGTSTDYVKLGQIFDENQVYEIEVGEMDTSGWPSSLGARIFTWYNGNKSGVAYDPTAGNWTIYDGTWNTPQTVEAAKDFFSNSKLKITAGAGSTQYRRKITVYKDGVELFSKDSSKDIVTATNYAYIGAEANSAPGLVVKSIKVYPLEV